MSNFDPFGNTPGNGQQPNGQYNGGEQPNGQQSGGQQNGWQPPNDRQFYGQQPPYGQPFYTQPPQPDDRDGRSAKIYGIVAMILTLFNCCCLPIGPILGIFALVRSGASRKKLGYLSSDAQLGKVLGIIAIILGSLAFVSSLIVFVFNFLLGYLNANGGAGTLV